MHDDKDKLFEEAFSKHGVQGADIAYYLMLFLPLVTGIIAFSFWGYAILFRPNLPEERLKPLLYVSCFLMGGTIGIEYFGKR